MLSLEFNFIMIAAHKQRPAMKHSQIYVDSTLPRSFQQEPKKGHAKRELLFSSINKLQLKNLQNYSNQKIIAAINTAGGSVLRWEIIELRATKQLICPHRSLQLKLLRMTKKHLATCSNKVGSISLVTLLSLC